MQPWKLGKTSLDPRQDDGVPAPVGGADAEALSDAVLPGSTSDLCLGAAAKPDTFTQPVQPKCSLERPLSPRSQTPSSSCCSPAGLSVRLTACPSYRLSVLPSVWSEPWSLCRLAPPRPRVSPLHCMAAQARASH